MSSADGEADGDADGEMAGSFEEPTAEIPGPGVDWDGLLNQLAAQPAEQGWVTLDEASAAAGVARSTLRSWYRSGQIASRMVSSIHGPQRLVPLEAVVERAFRSPRIRRQLDHARSLEAEVKDLTRRVEAIERLLGLGET